MVGRAAPGAQGPSEGRIDFPKLEQKLEALRVRWNVPGMSAAVARGGTILWTHGFGAADLAARRPATPDTVYHLDALTEPFAATVILQLVQEGRLRLDAPASEYGVQLKTRGMVRVRDLLSHTSEDVPGETYSFSENRFASFETVVRRVTRRYLLTETSQRVLEPLGLTNTCPNPQSVTNCMAARRDAAEFRRRLAQGYLKNGVSPVPEMPPLMTAGGLVSTVGDMVRFSAALEGEQLLGPEMRQLMFTPTTTRKGKSLPFGLGWFVQDGSGTRLIWHAGKRMGYSSLLVRVPGHELTFVLLANSDGLTGMFELDKPDVRRSPFARAFLEASGL